MSGHLGKEAILPSAHSITVLPSAQSAVAPGATLSEREAPLYTRYWLEALNSTLRRKADASSVDQWLGQRGGEERKKTKSTRVKTSKLEDAAAFAF